MRDLHGQPIEAREKEDVRLNVHIQDVSPTATVINQWIEKWLMHLRPALKVKGDTFTRATVKNIYNFHKIININKVDKDPNEHFQL